MLALKLSLSTEKRQIQQLLNANCGAPVCLALQGNTQVSTHKRPNSVCVHHHMFCLELIPLFCDGMFGNVFVVDIKHMSLPAWVQSYHLALTSDAVLKYKNVNKTELMQLIMWYELSSHMTKG